MRPKSPYECPLNPENLAAIGAITVALGHVDQLMTRLISDVFQVPPDSMDALLGDIPLGGREKLVRKCIARVGDAAVAFNIKAFCDLMKNDIIPRRNLMTHGCWGRYTDDWVTYRNGVYSTSKPTGRLYEDDLPKLFDSVCQAAWILVDVLDALGILAPPERYSANYTWSTVPGEPTHGTWLRGSVIRTIERL